MTLDAVLLRLRGYSVRFGAVRAVAHVDLEVRRGQVLALVGESGSGKSTLATGLLGVLPDTAQVTGSARLAGQELVDLPAALWAAIRWRQVAMVFQRAMSAFSPVHRIHEQFGDVIAVHRPDLRRSERRARTSELLALVGLRPEVADGYPHELSGGMLQRVAIALSLVHSPDLLILDEATTALDVITQAQILTEVRALQRRLGLTVIVITHDLSVVAEIGDRVVVMYAGVICEEGPVSQVLRAPRHPYTAALLSSIPRTGLQRGRLRGIAGSLPDLAHPPLGCVFAARCGYAQADCQAARPAVHSVADDQTVACLHPLPPAAVSPGGRA